MPTHNPRPVAVAVVQHAGRVLIGRRPEGVPLAGCWEFPGGKVTPGEDPSAAAARECLEETGLRVRIGLALGQVDYRYEHGPVRLFFFAAEPVDANQPPREPFRWIPLSALGDYAFPPANASILARLLQDNVS